MFTQAAYTASDGVDEALILADTNGIEKVTLGEFNDGMTEACLL